MMEPDRFAHFTLRRLAWAYGCSRRGTAEERELGLALIGRILRTWHPDRYFDFDADDVYKQLTKETTP